MLTQIERKRLTLALCIFLLLAVLFSLSMVIPITAELCDKNYYTGHKECPAYHIGPFLLTAILRVIDEHNGLVAALAGVAIAIFTFYLKRSTDDLWEAGEQQIKLARDDFNATHRPWMPIIDIKPGSGVIWANEGLVFVLEVRVKNIGNSPAQCVSLIADIFPALSVKEMPAKIADLQERHRKQARPLIGDRTVFPNPDIETTLFAPLMIEENLIKDLLDGFGGKTTEMAPSIVGSVAYCFPFGDGEPHYTPFARQLWQTDPNTGVYATIKLDTKNIAVEKLELMNIEIGGAAT